jgi:hypothetical protein
MCALLSAHTWADTQKTLKLLADDFLTTGKNLSLNCYTQKGMLGGGLRSFVDIQMTDCQNIDIRI